MKVATACLSHGKTAHAHAQKLLAAEKREEKKAKDTEKKAAQKAKATPKEPKPVAEGSKGKAPKAKKERKEPKTEYMRRKRSFMDKYLDCNIDDFRAMNSQTHESYSLT